MKLKSFICATFLLLGSMAATAQLEFGLTAGANLSTWDYTSAEFGEDFFTEVQNSGLVAEGLGETSYKPGFHGGIYAIFEFGPLTLMPEVLYSQKGSTKVGIINGGDIKATAHYLTVPLLIGLEPVDGFNIQVGPTFGLLMQDIRFTGNDYDLTSDLYETSDIGATLGLMYDWDGPGFASLRYTHGLTPVYDFGNDVVIQNRNLWVSVGFPLIFRGEKTGDSY